MSRKPLNAEADCSAHDAKAIRAHFDAESTESSLDAKADLKTARSTPRSSAGHQRQHTFAKSTKFKNREVELDAEKARSMPWPTAAHSIMRILRKRLPLNAKKALLTPTPTAALPKLMLFGSSSILKAEKASLMPRLTAY